MNTKETLNSAISAEDRVRCYGLIRNEVQERLTRLNHNNDVEEQILIPTLEKYLKKESTEEGKASIQNQLNGRRLQIEENNKAFESNLIALHMVEEKLEQVKKELESTTGN